jgi:hypothetical protein
MQEVRKKSSVYQQWKTSPTSVACHHQQKSDQEAEGSTNTKGSKCAWYFLTIVVAPAIVQGSIGQWIVRRK